MPRPDRWHRPLPISRAARHQIQPQEYVSPVPAGLALTDDDAIVFGGCQTDRTGTARYNPRRSMLARLPPSRFHLRAPRYGGQVALRRPRKGSPSSSSIRVALAAGCLAWIAPGCSRPPRLAADLVITRANVWTGD